MSKLEKDIVFFITPVMITKGTLLMMKILWKLMKNKRFALIPTSPIFKYVFNNNRTKRQKKDINALRSVYNFNYQVCTAR